MIRFGLVGCGAIYPTHADALGCIDGASLAGVYDAVPEWAKGASDRYGVPALSSLEDLCAAVDAVAVCVPSGLHAEVALACARMGKHVLVEKPIDTTLEKANAMIDGCRAAGVKLGVVSQHRFSRQIRRLRDALRGGELGPVLEGDASVKWYRTQQYYDSGEWRGTWALDGGGCLMNQGIHTVDMIQWIMGGVRAVQARVRTATHDIEVEDQANVLVEYRNGAIGVIQGSTVCYPGFAERLEVYGEHGAVVVEGDRTKVWRVDPERAKLGKYGDGVMGQPTPSLHLAGAAEWTEDDPTAAWGEQHRLQLEDFAHAVRDEREPFVTGEMALEPLRIILAAYESARQGGARIEVGSAESHSAEEK